VWLLASTEPENFDCECSVVVAVVYKVLWPHFSDKPKNFDCIEIYSGAETVMRIEYSVLEHVDCIVIAFFADKLPLLQCSEPEHFECIEIDYGAN
jgi:hypothetical protein